MSIALGFEELIDVGRGKRRVNLEEPPKLLAPIAADDRLQHVAPAMGAADVVGRSLLATMGRADGTVHIQDDGLDWFAFTCRVNPRARQSGEGGEIVICPQEFGLEPAHLAGGCAAAFDGLAADNPTYREIASEPVSVIHIFIAR